ncbi:hypothetical protein ILUMI_23419 [Ignelater luminosus]|uniref:Serpin domain-containing protein n=1 Tax=Ignelater luminosus TaxID=2038154 RepID=A0A8K0C857_IGNLU|nr:hypothetical protein ILUMI_23419 [Ignelater luminosus]
MAFNKFRVLFSLLLINLTIFSVLAQTNEINAVRDVSSSLNQFALHLLSATTDQCGDKLNLAISPYTVWSLMTIIAEGARGNTARQLEDVLKIPSNENKDLFRHNYKSLTKYLLQRADSVQLDISSAIFTTQEQELNRTYQAITKSYYGVDVMPTNFNNLVQAVDSINSYVSRATHNRIQKFVKIDDIIDAQIFMVATLFFKGQWKAPFNETFEDTFIDEFGNAKGPVKMMYQIGPFPYSIIPNLKAHAIELPYGKGDRMSMIVILPRKGEPLSSFLKQLAELPFSTVLDTLESAAEEYGEEDVQVYLPKFTITSDLNMNSVLDQMGIKDVFNAETADLLGIFPHYLYVSRVIQQAKIEVNEEGTVATAAAGASISYKSPPPKFYANRNFVYFIVDKVTKSIIFAGKVTNPNTICDFCAKKANSK